MVRLARLRQPKPGQLRPVARSEHLHGSPMTATRHQGRRALVFPAAMLAMLIAGVLSSACLRRRPAARHRPDADRPGSDTRHRPEARARAHAEIQAAGHSKLFAAPVHTGAADRPATCHDDRRTTGRRHSCEDTEDAPDRPDSAAERSHSCPSEVPAGRFGQGSRSGTAAGRTERESEQRSRLDLASRPCSRRWDGAGDREPKSPRQDLPVAPACARRPASRSPPPSRPKPRGRA